MPSQQSEDKEVLVTSKNTHATIQIRAARICELKLKSNNEPIHKDNLKIYVRALTLDELNADINNTGVRSKLINSDTLYYQLDTKLHLEQQQFQNRCLSKKFTNPTNNNSNPNNNRGNNQTGRLSLLETELETKLEMRSLFNEEDNEIMKHFHLLDMKSGDDGRSLSLQFKPIGIIVTQTEDFRRIQQRKYNRNKAVEDTNERHKKSYYFIQQGYRFVITYNNKEYIVHTHITTTHLKRLKSKVTIICDDEVSAVRPARISTPVVESQFEFPHTGNITEYSLVTTSPPITASTPFAVITEPEQCLPQQYNFFNFPTPPMIAPLPFYQNRGSWDGEYPPNYEYTPTGSAYEYYPNSRPGSLINPLFRNFHQIPCVQTCSPAPATSQGSGTWWG